MKDDCNRAHHIRFEEMSVRDLAKQTLCMWSSWVGGKLAKGSHPHGNESQCQPDTVIVCDSCMTAACWQGIFMCDNSFGAGTCEVERHVLENMELEHPSYWDME